MSGVETFDCYVGNLPLEYTESAVRELFAIAGEIVGVRVLPAKVSADGKVAFVKFTEECDAHCCAQYFNNHEFEDGRQLKVRYRPKSEEKNGTMKNGSPGYSGSLLNTMYKREEDEMEQIFVSHVESPIEFWGQPCTEIFAVQLQELTEKMETLCPYQPTVMGQISMEQIYGCKFSEDDLWYRCTVEEIISKNEVHVRYIDYGNAEDTNKRGLVILPNDLATLPAMCERYQCDGLELTTTDEESPAYEKGLDELIELINEERIVLKVKEKDKEVTIVNIYQDGDGTLLDIPTQLLPTGAVRLKTGGTQITSSFATAVKTPVSKATPPGLDTFPKANPYASIVANGNEPSLKSAFNQVIHDTPVTARPVKPTDLPLKNSFNDNFKHPESPVRTPFNQNYDSPLKEVRDWFSDPIEVVSKPMSNSPVYNNHIEASPTAEVKPSKMVGKESEHSASKDGHSSGHTPKKKHSVEVKRKDIASVEPIMTAELYREKIENSANIIEQLRRQLDEKTNLLEGYLHKSFDVNNNNIINDLHSPKVVNGFADNMKVNGFGLNDLSSPDSNGKLFMPANHEGAKKRLESCSTDVTSHSVLQDSNVDSDEDIVWTVPKVKCKHVGGYKKEIKEAKGVVDLPLHYGELYQEIGIKPPRGVLLTGSHGTGKTLIARAIANDSKVFVKELFGPNIVSDSIENGNKRLTKVFKEVMKNAPAILILDQIDVMAPKKESGKNKMVAKLLSLLNQLVHNVAVISTAICSDDIDPLLKKAGLFENEIYICEPDTSTRLDILHVATRKLNFSKGVCLNKLSEETDKYVGAHLSKLCMLAVAHSIETKMAAVQGSNKNATQQSSKQILLNMADFTHALDIMNSIVHEGTVEVPLTRWHNICGMNGVKNELKTLINHISLNEEKPFDVSGNVYSKGLLLYAPRGCGKELFAKAISNSCNCKLVSVKCHKFRSSNDDKSGTKVADIFNKVRSNSPCMLYIDELDHVTNSSQLLNDILREIDSIGRTENVFIIGATSRPSEVHPSFLRSNRLQHLVHIPLPDVQTIKNLLEKGIGKRKRSEEINSIFLEKLSEYLVGFTPSDILSIVQRVCNIASKDKIESSHFDTVLETSRRSVTDGDVEKCRNFMQKYSLLESRRIVNVNNNDNELKKPVAAVADADDDADDDNDNEILTEFIDEEEICTVPITENISNNNYVILLGLFTIACFIYLLGLYVYTTMRY